MLQHRFDPRIKTRNPGLGQDLAEEKVFFTRDRQKMLVVLVLLWAGHTAEMVGDTLREIAALIFIFVPLELWRDQSFQHLKLMEFAGLFSGAFFVIGVGGGYVALIFYRLKKDLEGPRETRPNS